MGDVRTESTLGAQPQESVGRETGVSLMRISEPHLPLETLIEADPADGGAATREERRILTVAAGRYVSVAELSAALSVPLDAVRSEIIKLSSAGRLHLYAAPVLPYNPGPIALGASPATTSPVLTSTILERVLDGLFAL